MKKLNILMIVPNLGKTNGVSTFTMTYYRQLDHNWIHIDFALISDIGSPYYKEILEKDGNIFTLPPVKNIVKHKRKCQKIIHDGHYDIIVDNSLILTLPLMICAKKNNIPVRILHSHNTRLSSNPLKGQIERIGLPLLKNQCTDFCACGRDAGKFLFGKKKFTEIPNVISPDVNKYQEKVVREQNRLSKLTRINNPECYNDKGVHIKGMRIKYSESMKRAKMRLRTAYRKQRVYVEQSNNHLANEWLEASGSVVKIETMNYKGLQKKASKSERQDTKSVITDKAGKKRSVHKFKRRKRFGGSILKHAPSGFLSTIKRKVEANCGIVIDVSALKLKASQYNHASDTYAKMSLSDREKIIDGHMVQRDCYSSFVIFYATNENKPDREGCLNGFEKFLVCQDKLIEEMIHDNFSNQNFGTKLINIKKQQLREEPAAA